MAFDTFKDSLSNMKNRPSMYIKLGLGSVTYENITAIFKKQSDTNGYILYNTEQMTVPKYLQQLLHMVYITKPVEIWDYSLANINILKEHGIYNTKFVPLVSSPELLSRLQSYRTTIDYDVGFCGGLSPRRNYIFNKLKENNIKINIIRNYGTERDKQLAKCRILINIHFSNQYKIFESARCEPWLRLGVPIISEKSIIDDPRCIVTDYDNLVNMTIQYLNYLKK